MRLLIGSLVGMLLLVPDALGQQLQGTFSLTGKAGYLTNAYLDPAFPVWERTARAPFMGVMPTAQVDWSNDRTSVLLQGRGRYTRFPGTAASWWLGQGQLRLQHWLSERWAVGVQGAGSRLRTSQAQWLLWGAPYLRWNTTNRTQLELRLGATQRALDGGARVSSPFALLAASYWSGLWFLQSSFYLSQTQQTGTSSLGMTLHAGRWIQDRVRLGVRGGTDRYGFDATASEDGFTSRLWHTAASMQWAPHSQWKVTGQLGLQHYQGGSSTDGPTDVYASAGLTYTLRTQRSFEESARPLWVQKGTTVQFRIPYEGDGRLFLVGDFNDWQPRTLRLHAEEGAYYTAQVDLVPGTYQYKVQVVEDGETRWLSLPDHALTVADGFGEENGVVYVE